MSGIKKFMFDTIFEELETIRPELTKYEQLHPENEAKLLDETTEKQIVPAFSQEDLDNARKDGFADGKEEGAKEASSEIEGTSHNTLQGISNNLGDIISKQRLTNQDISDDAVTLSLAVVRKIFPSLNNQLASDEIVATVLKTLDHLIKERKILIKVHPKLYDDLTKKLMNHADVQKFNDKLHILADDDIDIGDCKIEWSSGMAERNLSALMDDIDDIVLQNSGPDKDALSTEYKNNSESIDTSELNINDTEVSNEDGHNNKEFIDGSTIDEVAEKNAAKTNNEGGAN